MDQKDSLLGVVGSIYKWRKQIIGFSFGIAVIMAVCSLFLPNYFKSVTIFYAASPDLASPEALFGKSNESMDYYGEDEDVDRIMTIAKSNELKDFLIAKYNLYEHYEIDSTHIKAKFKIYERLEKLYEVEKTKYDAIELSFEDKDKELATMMANDARLKIDEIGQRLIKQSQAQVLKTYEENIRIKVEELNELNDSIRFVRQTYGVYNPVTQSEQLSTFSAKANSNLQRDKAKLVAFNKMSNPNKDSLLVIKARISGAQEELKQLAYMTSEFNKGMATVEVLAEIQEESSKQLGEDKQRYKQIQSAYSSQFPTIHTVEEAEIPVVKSRPKRSILVVLAGALSFFFLAVASIMVEAYKEVNWKEVLNQ